MQINIPKRILQKMTLTELMSLHRSPKHHPAPGRPAGGLSRPPKERDKRAPHNLGESKRRRGTAASGAYLNRHEPMGQSS